MRQQYKPTRGPIKIERGSDADFGADKSDRKSVSGCVLTMEDAVVSWTCKKKIGVSFRTMKAEFIAASHAGRELLGVRGSFGELEMKVVDLMFMWKYVKSTSSANHVDIRLKFMCHRTQAKVVQPSSVKSDAMMVDLLTKALPAQRISGLRGMFKLKAIQDDFEEEC